MKRGDDNGGSRPAEGVTTFDAQNSGGMGAPVAAYVRVAVLSALLVLVAYTGLSIVRLQREAGGNHREIGAATADRISAAVGGDLARLGAAMAAGGAMAQRFPATPMDAAEAALGAAKPSARAVGLVGESGVLAQAGDARDADWEAAAREAAASGSGFWLGRTPKGGVYAVQTVTAQKDQASDGARIAMVAIADLAPAVALSSGHGLRRDPASPLAAALVAPDGRLLTMDGRGADRSPASLKDAFQVDPSDLSTDKPVAGRLADGTHVELTTRRIADDGLVVVASPRGAAAIASSRAFISDMFWTLSPLAIGVGLAMLMLGQIRKSETARRAYAESGRRFRMAVEAAHCGIWEWDLTTDQLAMSDMTGAILGWGGGGVASGAEVFERVAAEHHDRLRQALAGAQAYGAFDVS
ncbi:MAG TPA: ATPase, partial [Caulobacteraceae bacterium]|nr:ATPase [Caulobacteraceae bacterium]